jgi:hypothetical protein
LQLREPEGERVEAGAAKGPITSQSEQATEPLPQRQETGGTSDRGGSGSCAELAVKPRTTVAKPPEVYRPHDAPVHAHGATMLGALSGNAATILGGTTLAVAAEFTAKGTQGDSRLGSTAGAGGFRVEGTFLPPENP